MQYFQAHCFFTVLNYLLIREDTWKHSYEKGKFWWERREVQWGFPHMTSGQASGKDKDVFTIYIAHSTKSYSGIPLQCSQMFV